jgi:predicted nucleotidyltransferase
MKTNIKTPIDWLFPQVRKRVLALLLTAPQRRWYLRQIAQQTGSALGTVRRELAGLTGAEIVIRAKDGNRTYYQANTDCPFFPELSGLLLKTAGLVDVLAGALTPLADKIEVAFVFGSLVGGKITNASDVDIMVAGKATFSEVVEALTATQNILGREVNPSVYPSEEFHQKIASGHHFLKTVLNKPKIFIIGDERGLNRLAQ